MLAIVFINTRLYPAYFIVLFKSTGDIKSNW